MPHGEFLQQSLQLKLTLIELHREKRKIRRRRGRCFARLSQFGEQRLVSAVQFLLQLGKPRFALGEVALQLLHAAKFLVDKLRLTALPLFVGVGVAFLELRNLPQGVVDLRQQLLFDAVARPAQTTEELMRPIALRRRAAEISSALCVGLSCSSSSIEKTGPAKESAGTATRKHQKLAVRFPVLRDAAQVSPYGSIRRAPRHGQNGPPPNSAGGITVGLRHLRIDHIFRHATLQADADLLCGAAAKVRRAIRPRRTRRAV